MNNKIIKFQLGNYFLWNNLSREDKVKRNKQIALLYLDKGPSILNYYNALKAYFGGFNPKNPYLITGEAPNPGIKSKLIISASLKLKKVGDVIINDPTLAYRQGYKGAIEHFKRTGLLLMNTNGANTLNPLFSQGKLFYGIGDNNNYPDLFVTSEKLLYSSPSGKLLGFDPPKPNKLIQQLRPGWTSNTKAAEPGLLNFDNVKAYTWEDGYGYREIPLKKKGGKAFHTGVNVLDSNLKMSKAASRKVKKAEDGTKINTFLKIGNFLNSDTGKAIGSTLMNGISAGFQAKQMNDAIKLYELASKSKLEKMMNGILADDSNYLEALLLMLLTKDENENISDTVVRAKAYDIAKLKALKKLNDYKDEINLNIVNMKQHANEQTINNFSGIFNLGMSGVMSLLNKKQTVDNGAPSLLWTLSEGWKNYLKASGYNV